MRSTACLTEMSRLYRCAHVVCLRVCILCIALTLGLSSETSASPPPALFRTATGEPVSVETLAADISRHRFVLLGEIHDNPEHHELQADILRLMIASGRKPALVWEMVERGKQSLLDQFRESENDDPDAFAEAVGWDETGWPAWKFYRPIAEVALAAGLPMIAGNLDAKVVRAISIGGSLDSETSKSFRLDKPFPETVRAVLLDAVYLGHCELLPRTKLSPFVEVQIARDASLAEAMWQSAVSADGAVLIAGAQHARRDIGAGFHLERRFGAQSIASIGLLEGDLELVWAGEEHAVPAERFDYVWYTDVAQPETDYCAELEARFKSFSEN